MVLVVPILAPWRLWPLVLCLVFPYTLASAEAIGMLKAPTRLGLAVGTGVAWYDDPAGPTRGGILRARYALHLERDLTLVWRGFLAATLTNARWPADTRRIGADGQSHDLAGGVARRLGPVERGLWLGAALRVGVVRLRNRHAVDDAGYLLSRWPDRSGAGLGVDLRVAADRVLRPGWRAGWQLLVQRRLSGVGFGRFVLAFSLYPVP